MHDRLGVIEALGKRLITREQWETWFFEHHPEAVLLGAQKDEHGVFFTYREKTLKERGVPIDRREPLACKKYAFTNTNVMLSFFTGGLDEIDLDPYYQRGLVWDLERKEALIDSLFTGLGMPAIYVREFRNGRNGPWMEVLDGKQRVSTLMEFVNDGFAYQGWLFSELPIEMQRAFRSIGIGIVRVYDLTDAEAEEIYDRLNFNGVPHKAEDRRKTKEA